MNGKFKSVVLGALVIIVAIGIAGVTLANDQATQIIGFCAVISTPLLILLSKMVESDLAKQMEERTKAMRDSLVEKLDIAEKKAKETTFQVLGKVQEVKVAVTDASSAVAQKVEVVNQEPIRVTDSPSPPLPPV